MNLDSDDLTRVKDSQLLHQSDVATANDANFFKNNNSTTTDNVSSQQLLAKNRKAAAGFTRSRLYGNKRNSMPNGFKQNSAQTSNTVESV